MSNNLPYIQLGDEFNEKCSLGLFIMDFSDIAFPFFRTYVFNTREYDVAAYHIYSDNTLDCSSYVSLLLFKEDP
jgi:hypothetical protein